MGIHVSLNWQWESDFHTNLLVFIDVFSFCSGRWHDKHWTYCWNNKWYMCFQS
jgi:hypothetical protein